MKKEELEVNNELPTGWIETELSKCVLLAKAGGTPSTKDSTLYGGMIPFVKIDDISDGSKCLYNTKVKINSKGIRNSAAWIVPKNSLVYSMYASYGIPIINKRRVATSQAMINMIFTKEILVEYMYYYLLFFKERLSSYTKGTTQANLNAEIVNSLPVKLAPLNEQKRIVSKIEKLFSNLDNSHKYLFHLEKQLKRYRQSVLKSAFDGELTREWRNRNKYSLDDWQYQTISDLANKIFAGGDKPETVSDVQSKECPYPIYSNGLKDNGLYGYTNIYKVEDECITISARGTIGFPLVRNEKFVPIVRLIVVIPKNYISSKYLKYYLESKIVVQSGSSIPQLTVPMVKQIEILVPKLEEQQEIANQIEKHFSIIDKLEAVVQQSIKESKRLRQSILKQAFDGKLVEQDSNDENASILLEKIAKAKEEYQKAQKKQVRKK
ncbi:restriction endonuclease subunit S [Aliarcobacter skirrowii]|uniref:restriction endonuclease subunit S n=1 Tax=Aliarcobacter skirrowii TaxID=28200 RepID=UPI00082C0304|nr:restriction endonuclease subunit S [Aliarcobacter skirrowii]MDX4060714.1 restriction endonuclease subunit S [Aliarcobacter skirrowii]